MSMTVAQVGWIPLLPLGAAAIIAVLPRRASRPAITLSLVGMAGALLLSLLAFGSTLGGHTGDVAGGPSVFNFEWFRLGTGGVRLGILLDPLAAVMLVMVSLVGLLIFVFSVGYMAHDDNVTRFFGFMSLFAAAMLGVVIANSLLLLFVCWEVVGLASYLLIGFWFQRPAAAAAAKKAFLVTRIGDLGLFLGMLWFYRETGTLLFYDGGQGGLEGGALTALAVTRVSGTLTAATAISVLIFIGAIGKSGQVPLHVWLPDAMEGPTPVSALIHAATMVAAGVFLVARVFPLMIGQAGLVAIPGSTALRVVTAVGAFTAFFAALLAVGQSDIKRILAYSTVSQLGYMFLGLGTGGVAVGIFHLITHAFFKALLFLGAGSVIHGCHDEQDIRRMGGLRRRMPWTFATYAVGMMALSGVPLLFSGFWSKDEILHAAWLWTPSRIPFVLGICGAFLTAFYMTRQMAEVFFGSYRGASAGEDFPPRFKSGNARSSVTVETPHAPDHAHPHADTGSGVHESPPVMTAPLAVLAVFAVLLGFIGTPLWPWFESYLAGHTAVAEAGRLRAALPMMALSTIVVGLGIGVGWWLFGRRPRLAPEDPDALEAGMPRVFRSLRDRLWVDEIYDATVVRLHAVLSKLSSWMDILVIGGVVRLMALAFEGLALLARMIDELIVNAGFDAGCDWMGLGGRGLSWIQSGRVQRYLGGLAVGLIVLTIIVVWGVGTG